MKRAREKLEFKPMTAWQADIACPHRAASLQSTHSKARREHAASADVGPYSVSGWHGDRVPAYALPRITGDELPVASTLFRP